jgi:hypothetical protein
LATLVVVPVVLASSLITCVCVNLVAAAMYFSLSGPYLDLGSDRTEVWFLQLRPRRLKHNRAELFLPNHTR